MTNDPVYLYALRNKRAAVRLHKAGFLDTHIRPLDICFSASNDEKGIKKAITQIKKHHPTRIIIEATGRLEHELIFALLAI